MQSAVILAAGRGRKFWPYSGVRNKCAFPIGSVPLVRRLAESLRDLGCERLVVVTGWQGGSVRAALAGFAGQVEFVSQPAPEGTADAVLRAGPLLGDEPFLVASGDLALAPENLRALRQRFAETDALLAALV